MAIKEGGCLCGAVRYEIAGPVSEAWLKPVICHCRMCMRAGGAPMVAWAAFKKEHFKLTSGTLKTYKSSDKGSRLFCGTCGSQIMYLWAPFPGEVEITTATLDDPDAVPPTAHIFTASKMRYVHTDDLPCHEANPDFEGVAA